MTLANKSAACSSCGKRLNRKHWYYRNGAYFCKRRCWETAQAKAAEGEKKGQPSEAAAEVKSGSGESAPST